MRVFDHRETAERSESNAQNVFESTLPKTPPAPALRTPAPRTPEDTRLLLRTGGGCVAVGLFFAFLMLTVFGGVTPQGPHTNSGWLALMVAMMCLPFGTILLALGVAKYLGHRKR